LRWCEQIKRMCERMTAFMTTAVSRSRVSALNLYF
jgi:hypothetical protein